MDYFNFFYRDAPSLPKNVGFNFHQRKISEKNNAFCYQFSNFPDLAADLFWNTQHKHF